MWKDKFRDTSETDKFWYRVDFITSFEAVSNRFVNVITSIHRFHEITLEIREHVKTMHFA